ncbi:uncharacterized protein Z518_10346 [Rhinocladiella mackenziei CBS 650.93]|uniref:Rhinocladiella mackenziei CBS 650.93 unplaced genomic scaffold supercont1.9, whole genome shotgun sequence n=1 Tax=Rhinocladiella mackenziei CBS 650.93 TaxID=1442369 RepID=A0A0D2GPC6_9EURO|nr:uncharacterized protein Z518_10346 [Rhinocladiella mackenziei CBS 650.93]KIX00208.1 hypothetical protein Z518_10346 [Rhinocladiella mackenziei CBS 650.93]
MARDGALTDEPRYRDDPWIGSDERPPPIRGRCGRGASYSIGVDILISRRSTHRIQKCLGNDDEVDKVGASNDEYDDSGEMESEGTDGVNSEVYERMEEETDPETYILTEIDALISRFDPAYDHDCHPRRGV